jgi:small-conductance mechanosensitive channel
VPHLSKPVYESLPATYVAVGAALLWASYNWRIAWWSTLSAALGFMGVVLGLVLWMHRRDFRATADDYRRRGRPVIDAADDQR